MRNKKGQFVKGDNGWVGRKHSPASILKMSESKKGGVAWNKGLKGYGKDFGFQKGNSFGKVRIGMKATKATLERLRTAHLGVSSGNKHWNWQGGVTSENTKVRHSDRYKHWRVTVFKRDGYSCQDCGVVGGELHADHIKQFAYYPELRFELSNGRTLCRECHLKTPTYGFSKTKVLCQ